MHDKTRLPTLPHTGLPQCPQDCFEHFEQQLLLVDASRVHGWYDTQDHLHLSTVQHTDGHAKDDPNCERQQAMDVSTFSINSQLQMRAASDLLIIKTSPSKTAQASSCVSCRQQCSFWKG